MDDSGHPQGLAVDSCKETDLQTLVDRWATIDHHQLAADLETARLAILASFGFKDAGGRTTKGRRPGGTLRIRKYLHACYGAVRSVSLLDDAIDGAEEPHVVDDSFSTLRWVLTDFVCLDAWIQAARYLMPTDSKPLDQSGEVLTWLGQTERADIRALDVATTRAFDIQRAIIRTYSDQSVSIPSALQVQTDHGAWVPNADDQLISTLAVARQGVRLYWGDTTRAQRVTDADLDSIGCALRALRIRACPWPKPLADAPPGTLALTAALAEVRCSPPPHGRLPNGAEPEKIVERDAREGRLLTYQDIPKGPIRAHPDDIRDCYSVPRKPQTKAER
jgi:hypothetical protein